jgi:dTDP-4-dehydrorhamnose 3,5-epimerase
MIKLINTFFVKEVKLVEVELFKDNRGFFFESYNKDNLKKLGILSIFCQDNISYSKEKYTLRGIHFQSYPKTQSKLLSVLSGEIIDIVVDLRKKSKTFGKYIKVKLSAKKRQYLFIPGGFGHGFCTLEKQTLVSYKVDNYYSPKNDYTLSIFDEDINIKIGIDKNKLILSKKDLNGKSFKDLFGKLEF